jgi:CheY-like chemotaxis protein
MSKILLIEDDVLESRMYQRLFSEEGFEIVTMENGQDSRQKAIDVRPDIILLDVMMPKMNGFETLDILQSDPTTKKIPVVLFTNLSGPHYADEALRRGATKFVVKSQMENKQLIQMIRDIISAYKPQLSEVQI